MTATRVLEHFADAIDARDWDALAALLADSFTARLVHTGETLDRAGFVALNRDYPGTWRFIREDVVGDGDRAVLRARVSSGDATYFVASFATVDSGGRLTDLVEVWTDDVAVEPGRRAW